MESVGFVGRDNDLQWFDERLEAAAEDGVFASVVAPAGYGKTELLNEFLYRCNGRADVYTFDFVFRESTGTEQFVDEFQEQWEEQFPRSFTEKLNEALQERLVRRGLEFTFDAAGAGSAVFPPLALAPLAKYALPAVQEGEDQTDLTPEVLLELLDEFSQERSDARLVLVFDQYDRVAEHHREVFDRLFRDLARELPENILCCVASRDRFYKTSDEAIDEFELAVFSPDETEAFLEEADIESGPELASQVHEVTRGHPYYLTRFVQLAKEKGAQATLDDLPTSDIQRYLDEEFRDQLEEEQESFLCRVCALPEFRPDTTAFLADIESSRSRRLLSALFDQAVIERLGYHEGQPVYQPHDLFLDHLRSFVGSEELNRQHRQGAVYYAKQLEQSSLLYRQRDIQQTFLTGEMVRSFGEHMAEVLAAGQMFDYHVRRVESESSLLEEIFEILEDDAVNAGAVMPALSMYYNQYGDKETWKRFYEEVDIDQLYAQFEEELEAVDELSEAQRSFIKIGATVFGSAPLIQAGLTEQVVSTLETGRERMRELVSESDVDEISGVGYLVLSSLLESKYEDLEAQDQAEQVSEEMQEFLQERWGLDRDDLDNALHIMTETVSDYVDEEDAEQLEDAEDAVSQLITEHVEGHEAIEELDDAEGTIDVVDAVEEQGTYGGVKASMEQTISVVDETLDEVHVEATDLFAVTEHVFDEVAQYFGDEDHPAVAAAIRDLNELIQLIYLPLFTSEQPELPPEEQADDEPEFESEFGKTRMAQQAKQIMEALDKVDQASQENKS